VIAPVPPAPVPDATFLADPYPGAVPRWSFLHVDGHAHPIADDRATLLEHGPGRIPVLAYGSNRCPSKITWLRTALGLGPEPVIVLRARTTGVAAVWAAGLRARDGARPAVLGAAPGAVEEHAVWLATTAQVAVLDVCEGRDVRFRLARLRSGTVTVGGVAIVEPLAYLGQAPQRRPLLVNGSPVRCADVPQSVALALRGDVADTDGLVADTVVGVPATLRR
jgi:hypothetical protein